MMLIREGDSSDPEWKKVGSGINIPVLRRYVRTSDDHLPTASVREKYLFSKIVVYYTNVSKHSQIILKF